MRLNLNKKLYEKMIKVRGAQNLSHFVYMFQCRKSWDQIPLPESNEKSSRLHKNETKLKNKIKKAKTAKQQNN